MRAILPLLLAVSLPLAAAPLHSQFLPPDDQSLRQEAPTGQQLLQVTDYSVVVGHSASPTSSRFRSRLRCRYA